MARRAAAAGPATRPRFKHLKTVSDACHAEGRAAHPLQAELHLRGPCQGRRRLHGSQWLRCTSQLANGAAVSTHSRIKPGSVAARGCRWLDRPRGARWLCVELKLAEGVWRQAVHFDAASALPRNHFSVRLVRCSASSRAARLAPQYVSAGGRSARGRAIRSNRTRCICRLHSVRLPKSCPRPRNEPSAANSSPHAAPRLRP